MHSSSYSEPLWLWHLLNNRQIGHGTHELLKNPQIGDTTYPTANGFREILNNEMNSLYLLSFLLTADGDKAEQCFIDGLGECAEENGVFMDCARSWARRAVLKHAIQMIMPVPQCADDLHWIRLQGSTTSAESNPFATILLLGAFERFVFVMSVLGGQSDAQCAILLRCSQRDVMIARLLALKCLADTDTGSRQAEEMRF